MNQKLHTISFDLQGTLTSLSFCENFWEQTLPRLYAQKEGISIEEACHELERRFLEIGERDPRFYLVDFWLKDLGIHLSEEEAMRAVMKDPQVFPEMALLISELTQVFRVILITSASRIFIKTELGEREHDFYKTYSTVDDFGVGGKAPEVYTKIHDELGGDPGGFLHIGDSVSMDYDSARSAGWRALYIDETMPRPDAADLCRAEIFDK